MGETWTYSIVSGDIVVASGMGLSTALIFVKALMNEYWDEYEVEYTIRRDGEDGKKNKAVNVIYGDVHDASLWNNASNCDDGK